jgi:hypothetical protein
LAPLKGLSRAHIIVDLDNGGTLVAHKNVRTRSQIVIVAASLAIAWSSLEAQKSGPAEIAASLSGSWKLNRDLSDSMAEPGRGGRRGGGALFALGGSMQRGDGTPGAGRRQRAQIPDA